MTSIQELLNFGNTKDKDTHSVEFIASKMTPVNEKSLHLPRNFAHTVRNILDMEQQMSINKHIKSNKK